MYRYAEWPGNYNNILQYDPLGWVNSWGYDSETAWFANIFGAADEYLTAVSWYTASPNSTYELRVCYDVTTGPTTGTKLLTQTGTIPNPGYQTIALDSPPFLSVFHKFSVVVKLTTPGYNYPIPYECKVAGYSSGAAAITGQSYKSSDGVNWQDFTNADATANCCLKAFTNSGRVAAPTFSPDGATYNRPVNVRIDCATSYAEIHYTTNGNEPTLLDPIIASGSTILVNQCTTVKAKAWKWGWITSGAKTGAYILQCTAYIYPPSGTYLCGRQASVVCYPFDAETHYTTNGDDPDLSDPILAPGEYLTLSESLTLKAIACSPGWVQSSVASADYTIAPCLTISQIKRQPDGALVGCTGVGVTGGFDDGFYIEEADRSSGIRVHCPEWYVYPGYMAELMGWVQTDADGERYIAAEWVQQWEDPAYVDPVTINMCQVGGGDFFYDPETGAGQRGVFMGSGLNNIGLLVRTSGWVPWSEGRYWPLFYGEGWCLLWMDTQGVVPSMFGLVVATGIVSCYFDEEFGTMPMLRLRSASDIQYAWEPL